MGFHSFSLDPRTVLGVGPAASLEEIHEAYRAKSKKHHPDAGGDEWAFRMVARAYEVLKTTGGAPAARPWDHRGAGIADPGRSYEWPRARGAPFGWPGGPAAAPGGSGTAKGNGAETQAERDDADRASSATEAAQGPGVDPKQVRTVGVELIWTRFESDGPARLLPAQDADAATLSVCMVISWPSMDLVDRMAEFSSAVETLRTLIDLFDRLSCQSGAVAARSRIEDGRFVGWLSYPDVLTAQDAFFPLRDALRDRGLTVKLLTRDERVPFDGNGAADQRVMSAAS
jgi:hypothetical protein